MGRVTAIAGAIAIILGGAAIGYAVTRQTAAGMSEAQSVAMATAVGKLDSQIASKRAEVHERARTLSELPLIRRAIVTDAKTFVDLVNGAKGGELANLSSKEGAPADSEILEVGGVSPDSGKLELWLLQPGSAPRMSHDGVPGTYVDLMGAVITTTEVVKVVPEEAGKPPGYLSITRELAVNPVVQPLLDAGITGKLVIGSGTASIGKMPAGTATAERPLGTEGAKLIVAEPPPRAAMPLPVLAGGIAAAIIGLLLLAIGIVGKRGAQYSRAFTAAQAAQAPPGASPPGLATTGIANAATQFSQHGVAAAAGTPAPIDPGASFVPTNLGPGAMIGRWEVVRRLGSGGMADVYLAQSKGEAGFEKLVAIKVMHGHLARNQRAVDHFLDEARLAARIHHPNVVAIQDLGKIGNDYVIVMEYVDGVDLERLLACARQGERPVPVAVGLGILCRICDGLDAAHRATSPDGTPLGIIHRDVKSANVLVSRQGVVKVVDFGIAKAANQVHYTYAGETKGTPSMMAPEQRVGEQVDVRADVYSVAAVGYEILTGKSVNLDLAALAHLGVENWPHLPPPSTQRAGLPPEIDGVLLTTMAFERDRRPADCAAFEALCDGVMKRYNLSASDKDIARWVESELRHLAPAFGGSMTNLSKSPAV
ncbi:MAG TPA: serine/threonine-protein kinase [Kofleriaceae bacterium]|nr:serine/threonine-protein kinase [Kofleriaceae bacterium]